MSSKFSVILLFIVGKFSLYNFCIAPVTQEKRKTFLYVWTEDVAGRGATEIGSAIYDFLLNEFPENFNTSCNLIRFFVMAAEAKTKIATYYIF